MLLETLAYHSQKAETHWVLATYLWMPTFAGVTIIALEVCQAHYLTKSHIIYPRIGICGRGVAYFSAVTNEYTEAFKSSENRVTHRFGANYQFLLH